MVKVNGKFVTNSKANSIIDKTVNSIILAGFSSSKELLDIVTANTKKTIELDIKILNKLLDIYSSNIEDEAKKVNLSSYNNNLPLIADKLNKIVEAICIVNDSVNPEVSLDDEEDEEDED